MFHGPNIVGIIMGIIIITGTMVGIGNMFTGWVAASVSWAGAAFLFLVALFGGESSWCGSVSSDRSDGDATEAASLAWTGPLCPPKPFFRPKDDD